MSLKHVLMVNLLRVRAATCVTVLAISNVYHAKKAYVRSVNWDGELIHLAFVNQSARVESFNMTQSNVTMAGVRRPIFLVIICAYLVFKAYAMIAIKRDGNYMKIVVERPVGIALL